MKRFIKIMAGLFISLLLTGCEEAFYGSERVILEGRFLNGSEPLKQERVSVYAIDKEWIEHSDSGSFGKIVPQKGGAFLIGGVYTDETGYFKCGFPTSKSTLIYLWVNGLSVY